MPRPRILIVDPAADRLPLYRTLLEELDAEGVIAAAGAEAETHAEALARCLDDEFALIVLSLETEERAGPAAARLIRAHPSARRIPIIFIAPTPRFLESLAAHEVAAQETAARQPPLQHLGPVDHVPAPVVPAVLRARMCQFVDLYLTRARLARCEALLAAEQRRHAQAEEISRLKNEFLASMSHELRTPLNSIFGWITLVRSGRLDAATQERGLATIERSARAQKRLIEDLLDGARIVTGKFALEIDIVDLRQVLEAACTGMLPAAEAKGLALVSTIETPGGSVRGDAARLQQVVCNLLSNAIKFTAAGGRVELALEWRDGHAVIAVRDSGQGIRPDFLPHVFAPFRQEDGSLSHRHGGPGLGLAVVHHLVELHGGAVAVASDGEGRGATFTVRIPAHRHDGAAGMSAGSDGAGAPPAAPGGAVLGAPPAAEASGPRDAPRIN